MVSVGIDIGKYSIKIAEVEADGSGFRLNRYHSIPLSIDPNKDTEIEILDALRNLAKEYDPTSTKFILGIPQNKVTVRQIKFPFKERHKILKSLPFELEDDIPISQENAIFNARINSYEGSFSNLLAVACPNEVVEKAIQLSEDCQFGLDIISIDVFGLSNLITPWQEAPPTLDKVADDDDIEIAKPAELFLDLGHESSNLIIMSEDQLLEVRSFDWGGKDLANALASHKSQHITEAIREVESQSLLLLNDEGATQDQIKTSNVLKHEIDILSRNLQLTLLEIKSQHNVNYVKGSLTGGLSSLKNLAPYLTQKIEVPFKKFNSFQLIKSPPAGLSAENGTSAGTAIGLAIEGIKKPKNPPLDLRLGDFKLQSQTFKLFIDKWSHSLQVTLAIFIFFVAFGILRDSFTSTMLEKAEDSLRDHASKLLDIKKVRVSLIKVNRHIREQKKIQKNLKMTEDLQYINSAMDILNLVSRKVPGRRSVSLNISNFSLNNQNLKIAGEVKDKDSLSRLMNTLKEVAIGNKVAKSPNPARAQSGWVPFAFSLKVNRREGN